MKHVKMWVSKNFKLQAKKSAAEKDTSMIKLTDQLAADMKNSQFRPVKRRKGGSYNNDLKF